VQPFFGEFAMGGAAIAHNGNITNAVSLRRELIERGSIFQSSSDTECIIHLMARSMGRTIPDRMEEALRKVEGAFSIVAMTKTKLIGCRDPLGVRPLVLGRSAMAGRWRQRPARSTSSGRNSCAKSRRARWWSSAPQGGRKPLPLPPAPPLLHLRTCLFLAPRFSILGGRSVYETREAIGIELRARRPSRPTWSAPCPTAARRPPSAIPWKAGIPFAMGIIRNQYVGRTFIEPTEQIRNMGVRLKLNVNRALIRGKRVILVDDSVVRGTTSRKIKEMILDAGAAEVHFRIASPPTAWPCFYGVDTPERRKAAGRDHDRGRDARHLGVDSLRFISLDGLYRAVGEAGGREMPTRHPQYLRRLLLGRLPGGARRHDRARVPDEDGGGIAAMQQLCRSIHDRWGTLDLWVHTAIHAGPLAPAAHLADKDFDSSVAVNLRAPARLIGYLSPLLGATGRAVFFDDPRGGEKFFGHYGSTKAAQIALATSWQAETVKTGPSVRILAPAPMPTALRGRFFPGEDRSKLAEPASEAARLLPQILG
jgi:amidophosphoribosyltransferase